MLTGVGDDPGLGPHIAVAAMLVASLPAVAQDSAERIARAGASAIRATARHRARNRAAPPSRCRARSPPRAQTTSRCVLRGVRIEGATVYSVEDLAALYRDLVGHEVTLTAGLRDRATHHRALRQRRLRALARDRAAATAQPGRRDRAHPGHRGLRRQGRMAGFALEISRLLLRNTPPRSSPSGRPTSEPSSAICCWPSDLPGLKFKNSLKPSATSTGAATLVVEVVEKPIDALARVDNRGSQRARPGRVSTPALPPTTCCRMHEAFTVAYASAFQPRELQYFYGGYRQVLTSEGLTAFVNDELQPVEAGTAGRSGARLQDPQLPLRSRPSAIRSSASASAT